MAQQVEVPLGKTLKLHGRFQQNFAKNAIFVTGLQVRTRGSEASLYITWVKPECTSMKKKSFCQDSFAALFSE